MWGAIKPLGKQLILGEVAESELQQSFADRARDMEAAGADALLIESMTDVEEAVHALRGARQAVGLKIGIALVFGSGADQMETVVGDACEEATRRLVEEGADLAGCNCGLGIDDMVLVIRLMRGLTDLPLLACPDAGQKELDGDHIVHRETPENFASKIPSLVGAGASVIGGCCGIRPEHLAAAAAVLSGE